MTANDGFIVACPRCGVKNRIDPGRVGTGAKCGKCSAVLESDAGKGATHYLFRCPDCGTRNRIPSEKLQSGAKCGKCGSHLQTGGLFIPQPLIVTDGNFESGVVKSPLPVVLFAWAPW